MNVIRMLFVVSLAAGLLAGAFAGNPQPITEVIRGPAPAETCAEAYAAVMAVDIPARRADYSRMDDLEECAKAGSLRMVPVTGASRAPVLAYDATAAMNAAVVQPHEVRPGTATELVPVTSVRPAAFYDATAAMNNAVVLAHEAAAANRAAGRRPLIYLAYDPAQQCFIDLLGTENKGVRPPMMVDLTGISYCD